MTNSGTGRPGEATPLRRHHPATSGFTLVDPIVSITIPIVLVTLALPEASPPGLYFRVIVRILSSS